MNKCFCVHLIFVLLSVISSCDLIEACSNSGGSCAKNEDCCSISNGKPYCNGETGRCEALRYCDKSTPDACPFNDLSAAEINILVALIKNDRRFSAKLEFILIRKQEPKKKLWNSGAEAAFERMAYAAIFDRKTNRLYEVSISLTKQRIVSVAYRPNSIPPISSYEYELAAEIALADRRVIYAYESRGLNASNIRIDTWAFEAQRNTPGRRQVRIIFNYKDETNKYMDWRPVEGLLMTIDIAARRVLEFIDTKRNVPVPTSPLPSYVEHEMPEMPPTTPTPPSFNVDGFHVNWSNWNFQYSMDPIHGLQLYHIRYRADCDERFLIYKMSISEMFVPYGASGYAWRWRGAFDAGVYGLSISASPIMLGVDVPPNAKLLSCLRYDMSTGEAKDLENCIAVYERPVWPVYYHYDSGSDTHDAKAGTELVITSMCTVGNYDYMWEYVFSMDGTIMVMVMATGILLSRAVFDPKNDPNCIETCEDYIHEHVIAPLHQHYANFRIDLDVDGASNTFLQNDFKQDPISSDNPDGGAFSLHRTIVPRETYLSASPQNARFWTMINTQSRNDFHSPRGYSIHPNSITPTFLMEYVTPLTQAQFIQYPIWVTRYNDNEQGAAGPFPRSGKPGQGLPDYIRNGESLRNTDIVLWHTLGFSHAPRPEEHPFMNKHMASFMLMPRNFMSANPLVNERCAEHHHDHHGTH